MIRKLIMSLGIALMFTNNPVVILTGLVVAALSAASLKMFT
jgi:hypothetical protein